MTYFELLVLRFIKLWIEMKVDWIDWASGDVEQLHKEVSAAIAPKTEGMTK